MKKDSLVYRYQKAMKEKAHTSNETKRKIHYNYVTKLFFRIFLSSVILLGLVVSNRVFTFKDGATLKEKTVERNWNFMKLAGTFNALFGNFLPKDIDQVVYQTDIYEQVVFHQNLNYVENTAFNGVKNLTSGVVSCIKKGEDGTFSITIQSIDDFEYTYMGLKTSDVSIYSYVSSESILGLAEEKNGKYTFMVKIQKDGKAYDFYDMSEN